MAIRNIDTTPDPNIQNSFARNDLKWFAALLDILDNSVDAHEENSRTNNSYDPDDAFIKVDIERENREHKRIVIADNATGISKDRIGSILSYGRSEKRGGSFLGTFGVGLKLASTALGHKLVVISTTSDIDDLACVSVDFEKNVKNQTFVSEDGYCDGEDIPKEYVDIFTKYVGDTNSGTVVLIERLKGILPKDRSGLFNTLREKVGLIYRHRLDKNSSDYPYVRFEIGNRSTVQPIDPFCVDDPRTRFLIHDGNNRPQKLEYKGYEFYLLMTHLPIGDGPRPDNLGSGILGGQSQGLYCVRGGRQVSAGPFWTRRSYSNVYAEIQFVDSGRYDDTTPVAVDSSKKGVVWNDDFKRYLIDDVFAPKLNEVAKFMEAKRTDEIATSLENDIQNIQDTPIMLEDPSDEDSSDSAQTEAQKVMRHATAVLGRGTNGKAKSKTNTGTYQESYMDLGDGRTPLQINIEHAYWPGSVLAYDCVYEDGKVTIYLNDKHSWTKEHLVANKNDVMRRQTLKGVISFLLAIMYEDAGKREKMIQKQVSSYQLFDESLGVFNDYHMLKELPDSEAA